MNTKLTKLIGSAAAVLVVGSSAYAQQSKACPPSGAPAFEQGYGLTNDKFPAAYNAAARIDVQNTWDFFLSGSFIYWHADQEGMDLAIPVNTSSGSGYTVGYPTDDHFIVQNFKFKPGFKAAIGMDFDYDNWVGAVEYTWFHQTTHTSASAPIGRKLLMSDWFLYINTGYASDLSSHWRSNLDIVDATMSRPYYQGKKLTILPFGGIRAAWIRQSLRLDMTPTPLYTTETLSSHNKSHSWAVGPRAGLDGHWLLGWGFRLEGDVAGSILFTQYRVSHHESALLNPTAEYMSLHYHQYNTLRPMTEMKLGLGWGSYFDRQNYHFDLLATYDFNVLWGQNMMRSLVSTYESRAAFEAADLHLQGLTVSARFDF